MAVYVAGLRAPAPALRGTETDYAPFDAQAYLDEYYADLGEENRALLDFLCASYAEIFADLGSAEMLEFGGGPTVYQLISTARHPVRIHFSDYLESNLATVRAWMAGRPGSFDWDPFIRYALAREGLPADAGAVARRRREICDRVTATLRCDARERPPVLGAGPAAYDIVSANFVLEAISQDVAEWSGFVSNALTMLRPGGYFVVATVTGSRRYRVGDRFYPATPISEGLLRAELERGGLRVLRVGRVAAQDAARGYAGICMALARRPAAV